MLKTGFKTQNRSNFRGGRLLRPRLDPSLPSQTHRSRNISLLITQARRVGTLAIRPFYHRKRSLKLHCWWRCLDGTQTWNLSIPSRRRRGSPLGAIFVANWLALSWSERVMERLIAPRADTFTSSRPVIIFSSIFSYQYHCSKYPSPGDVINSMTSQHSNLNDRKPDWEDCEKRFDRSRASFDLERGFSRCFLERPLVIKSKCVSPQMRESGQAVDASSFRPYSLNAAEWKSTLLGVILGITSFWSGNPLSK